MAAKYLTLPVEYLHQCFSYDPETGVLTWKERPREHFANERAWKIINTRHAGKTVQAISDRGYYKVQIGGMKYFVSRIVWAMHYGKWPKELIDHINGTRSDNRIANLRESTYSENSRNRGADKCNTAGLKGVSFHKVTGKYQARINDAYLGLFATKELAHAAYCEAADRLHGEFANHG